MGETVSGSQSLSWNPLKSIWNLWATHASKVQPWFDLRKILIVLFSCNRWNFQCSSALGRTSTETLRVRCRFQLKRRSWNSHNSDSTVEHGFLNVTRCWKCHFQKKFSAGSKFSFRQLRSFGSHDQPQNEDCYLWCILTKTYLFDCLSTFVLDMQEFVG